MNDFILRRLENVYTILTILWSGLIRERDSLRCFDIEVDSDHNYRIDRINEIKHTLLHIISEYRCNQSDSVIPKVKPIIFPFKKSDVNPFCFPPYLYSLRDICESLEIKITRGLLIYLKMDSQFLAKTEYTDLSGYNQLPLTEEEIYKLIFLSELPEAIEFTNWVFMDLYPGILTYGILYLNDIQSKKLSYWINRRKWDQKINDIRKYKTKKN